MNKAELLERQLGLRKAGRAGGASLRDACRRFLAPPLAWRPTSVLMSRLEAEGYWRELVEQAVPVFVIEVIDQNVAIQNIDSFFVEYIRRRLPRDESIEINLPLVKRALFEMGLALSIKQLLAAKALHDNRTQAGEGTPSAIFFRFCLRYAQTLFG